MRKRQFKKVLSLVLALAMVFTMNTSVFATGINDPAPAADPVVEEPAAEENAETPVTNDEKTVEEKKEETPADQVATVPKGETTPAPEAAHAESEDPAGTDAPTGWTGTGGAWSGEVGSEVYTVTDDSNATLTAVSDADGDVILSVTGSGKVTVTIDGSASGTAKLASGTIAYTGSSLTIGDGTLTATNGDVVTKLGGVADVITHDDETPALVYDSYDKFFAVADGSDKTEEVDALAATASVAASTYIAYNSSTHASAQVNAVVAWTTQTAPTAGDFAINRKDGDDTKIEVKNNSTAAVGYKVVEKDVAVGRGDNKDDDLAVSATAEATVEASKAYDVYVRLEKDTTKYSSNWTKVGTIPAVAPEPDPEGTFTVSGYKFTLGEGTSSENMAYTSGVGTLTLKGEGEVTIEDANPYKALSINLAKDTTLVFDSSNKVTDYSLLSIKGEGAIRVNNVGDGSPIYTKAFESVTSGITISGNNANVLISSNIAGKAAYTPIINGKDEAMKMSAAGRVVAVALAETNPKYDDAGKLDPNNYLLDTTTDGYFETGTWEVLSENKTEFSDIDTEATYTVSKDQIEGISIPFGSRPIFTTDSAALDNATVIDVPTQSTSLWINRFIPGMENSSGIDVSRDTDQAIYVNEDGEQDESGALKYTYYKFTLSTNGSGEKDAKNWQDGPQISNDFNGHSVEPNKKYYLYTYRKATSKEYKSDVVKVCEFTTLKETSVSINLASSTLSPNYIGDANDDDKLKAVKDRTDIVNAKFFNFKLNGFESGLSVVDNFNDEGYDNNNFTVVDGDNFAIGTLTVNFGQYKGGHAPTNIEWYDTWNYYNLSAANDGKEKHYVARVSFIPASGAPTQYTEQDLRNSGAASFDTNLWKSGVVSFNIIKAPVKVEPDIQSPAVSGQAITTGYKATNKITGQPATLGGSPLYLFNNQRTNDVSWNNAGKSVFPVGTHTVTVSGEGLTAGNYEIDPKKNSAVEFGSQELKIVDPNGSDGLKVTGVVEDVFYGTTAAGIKAALSTNFTFGGVGINETADKAANASKIKLLASESSNVAAATELTDTEKVSANTTIYAYYIDAQPTRTGYDTLKASSNAIPIKIQPRKVYVSLKEGEFKTKRGDDLITKISSNKLVVKVYGAAPNYVSDKVPMPAGVDGDKFFTAADIALNTARVNKNVPKNYPVALTGYTISSDYAQNYVINESSEKGEGDVFNYKVDGRYWVKYILEYGGQGAKTGKRYVSEDVIDIDDVNFGVTTVDIEPKSKIANASWNGILAEGDEITGWEIKEATDLNYTIDTINTFGGKKTVTLYNYDFAVYAVVSAKATSQGVMVESITPVEYDGFPHVVGTDGSTKKRSDLTLNLYDTNNGKTFSIPHGADPDDYNVGGWKLWKENEKGKDIYAPYLTKGIDYTISYKNNKNASVAYDESVSGNDGIDATFKRIVTDAKMPQVVVKGKGDYKSLKTTVLFDIVPAAYVADGTEALTLQLAGKKLNTKANVTFDTYKKLNSDGTEPAVTDKTYKLKAGKYNTKKGTYTGDYIMEVYSQAKNGSRTLLGNAKDLKKIAAGDYYLVFKGVNNFRGNDEVHIEVKDGVLLSKQKFKWTKKVNWAEKVTIADFKIKATTAKKPKTDIALVKYAERNDKAGYYISSIYSNTKGGTVTSVDWGEEPSEYVFADAGSYTINIVASKKLGETSSIFGSHSLKVEVKGTKLKASDFTIEGKAANKTVIIDYDGKNTAAPVAVALKKPSKFPVSEKNKIPMGYGSKRYQAGSPEAAEDNILPADASGDGDWAEYLIGLDDTYLDTGVAYKATLVKSGVYNLAPTADNTSVFTTYIIKITPSGKYYGPEKDGSVRLTYKRGNVDLKKALNKIIKVTSKPVEVNIGGTNADLLMTIEGMTGAYTNPSDNKAYFHNQYANDGKQYMWEDGDENPILAVTYSKNKKVGTGTATIKPTKYGKKYFKGSLSIPFTIKTKTVNPIVPDYDDTLEWHGSGDVLAVVNDVVTPKSGTPKASATLYQVTEFGDKVTKLGKKDYTITTGTFEKEKGYPVLVTAGSSGNFKFENEKKEAKAPTESYFNTFGKKAKKIVVTLSQGEASGYDAAKKGYVYTGKNIDPKVVSITVDGQALNIPAEGLSTSCNFAVKYNNDVKVGTATATVTLKADYVTKGLSGNDIYPIGGTAKVKYKIVPHTNNNLILNK